MQIPQECDGYPSETTLHGHLWVAKVGVLLGKNEIAMKALEAADTLRSFNTQADKFSLHRLDEYSSHLDMIRTYLRKDDLTKSPIPLAAFNTLLSPPLITPNGAAMKLEVCSGNGEWITRKCASEPHSIWVASELRYDRCFDIAFSAVLAGIKNLIICFGDIRTNLINIPDFTLSEIHINYPEPPACHEDFSDSGTDLLTVELFSKFLLKMKSHSYMRIITDNGNYAGKLLSRLKQVGRKPTHSIISSEGASYFDRLFKRGGKSLRYELVLPVI